MRFNAMSFEIRPCSSGCSVQEEVSLSYGINVEPITGSKRAVVVIAK